MKWNFIMRFSILILLCVQVAVYAGESDSPAPPEDPASAVFTIEDVYNRLESGVAGEKRTGAFTEPESGPGFYGHTLDEVMDKAPAPDNTNGALPRNVMQGQTFWGLRTDGGGWGPQTGTIQTQTLSDTTVSVDTGVYNETTLDTVDTDLAPGNIKSGVTIFGVAGSAVEAAGDAAAGDVLSGRTFSKAGASGLTGTMPVQTLSDNTVNVSAGYYNATALNSADPDLESGNIAGDVTIFGVTGSAVVSAGDAAAGDVLSGRTFSKTGAAGLTGTMPNRGAMNFTPGISGRTVPAGYHNGSGTVAGDADLTAANIRSGITIFAILG
ncbi:MAG: hypothetical protein GY753_15410, partial [Gammaproteobacteria bacterium]|nr:hypothetical protein [Gammaproteobacteria bacterium]